MKFFLLLFLAVAFSNPILAEVLYKQTSCRSGDNSLQIDFGNEKNQILILEKSPPYAASPYAKTIALNLNEVELEYSETVRLEGRAISTCSLYEEVGEREWYNIKAQRVRIEKNDGSNFHPHTVGVSQDLRSVELFVICEEQGLSEVQCGPDWQKEEPPPQTLQSRLL